MRERGKGGTEREKGVHLAFSYLCFGNSIPILGDQRIKCILSSILFKKPPSVDWVLPKC